MVRMPVMKGIVFCNNTGNQQKKSSLFMRRCAKSAMSDSGIHHACNESCKTDIIIQFTSTGVNSAGANHFQNTAIKSEEEK
ncbi:MAG: hypothetical protein FWE66_04115, partial [Oscillospiraceae bacterium]|nr:hypothetical protein [Oscillospiraceae bacterium]